MNPAERLDMVAAGIAVIDRPASPPPGTCVTKCGKTCRLLARVAVRSGCALD